MAKRVPFLLSTIAGNLHFDKLSLGRDGSISVSCVSVLISSVQYTQGQ